MAVAPEGGTTGQRARSKRVVNEEIVQDRAPDLNSYGRWARGIDIRAAADAGAAMAVVLREQLELRPSVELLVGVCTSTKPSPDSERSTEGSRLESVVGV